MKFFITGAVRSPAGPRRILTYALLFLLFFLVAHGIREFAQVGSSPAAIRRNLAGSPPPSDVRPAPPGGVVNAPGFIVLLEDLHVDLFLYSLVSLFLGSLVIQARLSPGWKKFWVLFLFAAPLCYAGFKPATRYLPILAHGVFFAGILFHLGTGALTGRLLLDLYRDKAP